MFDNDTQPDPDGLRYYQRDASEAAIKSLRTHRACLLVLATGLGKTQIAGAIARAWPGNILFLAHRDELVTQAQARLEAMTGEWTEREQGTRTSYHARIVVGSVQSVMQSRRLQRMGSAKFSLIIVDEAHHYSAKSFRKPLDYFKGAKVLGITATPDRADKMALGQIFDDAPFRMDIVEGIEAGYLVPLECSRVHLDAISLDSVGKSKGDLNTGELDAIMVEACEGIAQTLTGLHPGKQAIVFMPGIRSSEYVAAKLNVLVPGSAVCISSESELVERAEQVKAFKEGKILYFCNCGIATEGFDAPDVSIIAIGRPTLSRSLYAQMVGRGTRPKAGTVDHIIGASGAAERRAAIAASTKPRGIILDFVGVGEKHDLASPEDLLGGDYTPAEIKLAKAKAAKEPGELVEKNLAVARAELQAIAAAIRAKVQSRILRFDPFGVMREQSAPGRYDELSRDVLKPDPGLVEYLKKAGLKSKEIAGMSELQARRFRAAAVERQRKGLASYRQLRQLERHGFTDANVSMAKAKAAMDYMDSLGWDHSAVDHSRLATILGTQPRPQPEGAP